MPNAVEGPSPPPDLERDLLAFQRKVRNRNLREWAACAVVTALLVWERLRGNRPFQLWHVASFLGLAFVAWRLHRDGTVRVSPADRASPEAARRAYVRELIRQAAFLDAAFWWYVLPLAVGPAILLVGRFFEQPTLSSFLALGVAASVASAITWTNKLAARDLRKRIPRDGKT